MLDLSDVLRPDDVFARTNVHFLVRGDETIFILVHEVLSGEKAGKFVAHPSALLGSGFKNAAVADSYEEALRNCLRLIKDLHPHEMDELLNVRRGN
jgi:hypothetical protein